MKKVLCILLSLVMLFTLGLNVYATVEGEDDADVPAGEVFPEGTLGGGVDDDELGAGDIFGNPIVSIGNVSAYSGSSVVVDMVISVNPGFTDMTVAIEGEGVTVTAVENGEQGTATLNEGNVVITSDTCINGDICIAKVTLTVDGEIGKKEVSISVTATNEETNVAVEGANFTITVEEDPFVYGDVNGDGSCDTSDLAEIKLYLAGAVSETTPEIAALDINTDGVCNTTDLAILKLYIIESTVA